MKKQSQARRSHQAAKLAVDAAELQALVAQLVAEQLQQRRLQEGGGLQRPAPAPPRELDDEAYADAWVAC